MKYLYFGVALLVIILVLSVLLSAQTVQQADAVIAPLQQALHAAHEGDEAAARKSAAEARAAWEEILPYLTSLLSHDETDPITHAFAKLEESTGDDFRQLCAELIAMLEHVREMDQPHSYNLL